MAATTHEGLGGGAHRMTVDLLVETIVDTTPDAVLCAAAAAAWTSLGRDVSDVVFAAGVNGWEVTFVMPAVSQRALVPR
ncbi:Hypothetical protein A7982_06112 [Minicystis rosea]|nr:Hypothetical protein A7982_06112 [Minicystis rosea]